MAVVSRVAIAAALAASALSILAHNLYELPLSPIAVENSGPATFAAILGVAYCRRTSMRARVPAASPSLRRARFQNRSWAAAEHAGLAHLIGV